MKAATGEVVSAEDLGGADVHARKSGVADHLARTTMPCAGDRAPHRRQSQHASSGVDIDARRRRANRSTTRRELEGVVPTDLKEQYDIREVIARLVDGSEFDEFKQLYGTTLVTGFARIHGMPGRHHRQ